LREVTWKGKKIPIKNEKLRVCILSAQEVNYELEKTETFDGKMSVYDKLFICYGDAVKIIKDEFASSVRICV
jgi:signal recognition particle subunit SRP68